MASDMNKIFGRVCSALTAAALLAGALTACGGQQAGTAAPDSGTTGSAFTEGTSAERLAADTTPEEEKYGGTRRHQLPGPGPVLHQPELCPRVPHL